MKAEDMAIRPVLSLLSKGRSGTGKTIASCGKEFRPVYVMDFDGRFDSVLRYYKKLDGHVKDIESDFYSMGTGFYQVDKFMDDLVKSCPYKTVSVASLTNYINLVLNHLRMDKKGQRSSDGKMKGRSIAGIQVNELQDYLAEDATIVFELIGDFIQELRKMGVNTILEAHITPYEITSIDPDSRAREVSTINQVLTKGKKAPAQLPVFFNECYMFNKEFVGFGKEAKYKIDPVGNSVDVDCKTSMGIEAFDWTGKDFSELLWEQVDDTVKQTSRIDPNAPKKVRMG